MWAMMGGCVWRAWLGLAWFGSGRAAPCFVMAGSDRGCHRAVYRRLAVNAMGNVPWRQGGQAAGPTMDAFFCGGDGETGLIPEGGSDIQGALRMGGGTGIGCHTRHDAEPARQRAPDLVIARLWRNW